MYVCCCNVLLLIRVRLGSSVWARECYKACAVKGLYIGMWGKTCGREREGGAAGGGARVPWRRGFRESARAPVNWELEMDRISCSWATCTQATTEVIRVLLDWHVTIPLDLQPNWPAAIGGTLKHESQKLLPMQLFNSAVTRHLNCKSKGHGLQSALGILRNEPRHRITV